MSFPLSLSPFQDYCASKFGAVGFHESLTHELQVEGLDGIKTTLVCPYIVDTGMFAGCEIRQDTSITLLAAFLYWCPLSRTTAIRTMYAIWSIACGHSYAQYADTCFLNLIPKP